MKLTLIVIPLLLLLGCSSTARPAAQKHYPLTGKVVSIDAKDQSAAIDAAAIPGYMEAMTMDYPIDSKADLALLHVGDHITGTLDVNDDGTYVLSHIKIQPSSSK